MTLIEEPKTDSAFLSLDAERRADLFFHAFRSAPDGLVIVDPRGIILYANVQAESLFGYSSEEMVDRPVETLLPIPLREAHVADRDAYGGNSPSPGRWDGASSCSVGGRTGASFRPRSPWLRWTTTVRS